MIKIDLLGGQQCGDHTLNQGRNGAQQADDTGPMSTDGCDRRSANQAAGNPPFISNRNIP